MRALCIQNGTLVTSREEFAGDLLILDGRIAAVRRAANPWPEPLPAHCEIIDASGCFVLPGAVDPHVHFSLPVPGGFISADDFDSGTAAALSGGVTSVLDFVTPPRDGDYFAALHFRKEEASRSRCDYGLHMSIVSVYPGLAADVRRLADREGVGSFKLYMAYKSSIGLNDRDMLEALDAVAGAGGLALVHCEDGDVIDFLRARLLASGQRSPSGHPLSRPPEAESEAVRRVLWLASLVNCPLYLVHLSTAAAVEMTREARRRGQTVYAETCPHYLLLDESQYLLPGGAAAAYVMSPPLRSREHRDALRRFLTERAIDVVATDHCPFHMADRERAAAVDFTRIPGGVGSVGLRIPLLYTYGVLTHLITLPQLVELCCETPSRIFGLHPAKGSLTPGADADVVLWDFSSSRGIVAGGPFLRCDHSVYEGFRVQARAKLVLLRGETVFMDNRLCLPGGTGKFLPVPPLASMRR